MSSVLAGDFAGRHIPQENSLIKTTGTQLRAVTRTLSINHFVAVTGVSLQQHACTTIFHLVWVPQLDGLVSSTGHTVVTISCQFTETDVE